MISRAYAEREKLAWRPAHWSLTQLFAATSCSQNELQ